MGIDVQLRSETGEVLAKVGDPGMVLSRASGRMLSGTRLLKYVVPWGDTVFNQAQAEDLELDIADVRNTNSDPKLLLLLSKIELLISRLAQESHLYLWFIGD